MLNTNRMFRQRLAVLLCLLAALTAAPAAFAIPPPLEEGESVPPVSVPTSGLDAPEPFVEASASGVDWTSVALVAAIVIAAATVAAVVIAAARDRSPQPAAHS